MSQLSKQEREDLLVDLQDLIWPLMDAGASADEIKDVVNQAIETWEPV